MFLLATASGMIAANIYYAQPLIEPISASLCLPREAAGLIVTLLQVGYGAGLLLIAPLADLTENRRLVLASMALATAGLLGAALSTQAAPFFFFALCIGLGSVAVQVLIPFAAHLAPPEARGRVVGDVTGLMLGIMVARPVSSFIAAASSWRAVFFTATAGMTALALVLAFALPPRRPHARMHYGAMLASMVQLASRTPVLRQRALYHMFLFGAFSLFWTTTPLLLAGPFHLSQNGIALFALAGVSGAIAAPLTGRIADRGHSRLATGLAMATVAVAYLITNIAPSASTVALALLVLGGILVDFGVQAHLVLGYRAIYGLDAQARGRLNGLFMASFFVAGAVGSAVGAWAYEQGGWRLASGFGLAFATFALIAFALDVRDAKRF
ncbi:MAG: MFS transporter [Hyphomicrobiales bacterium]|nr:MFS transporter [Hyphomicrobiales bacterium]MBV8661637.1 MFS transporter [Hyphomicrobiales bacterium]